MPPKKKVTGDGADAEETSGPFRWTIENERKLLILIQGRYLTVDDYERLLTVFPGTNLNGVKIKVSRFRVEQRDQYKELGWDLPDGGAGSKRKTPVKSDGAAGEPETPTKKPRKRKTKGEKGAEAEKEVKESEPKAIEDEGVGGEIKEESVEHEA